MYPARELNRLAARKAALQRDIGLRRARCAAAMARVAQPVAWLDWTVAFYRRHSPLAQFAAVALGLFVRRPAWPRLKIPALLVRWGPLLLGVVRAIRAAIRSRPGSSRSSTIGDRRRAARGNGLTEACASPEGRGRWK